MTAVSVVVGLDGYDWKFYKRDPDRWGRTTRDFNVHLSLNGPLQMTFEEAEEFAAELAAVIADARKVLEDE
jgi:hypothetical protein